MHDIFDTVALTNTILNDAIAEDAKHIFVEPQQEYLRVRVRVGENTIRETMRLPGDCAMPLVAQFKKLAGLNLLVATAVQRGFLVFTSGQMERRFWTRSLPTRYGEKVVVSIMVEESLSPELRQPTYL